MVCPFGFYPECEEKAWGACLHFLSLGIVLQFMWRTDEGKRTWSQLRNWHPSEETPGEGQLPENGLSA